MPGFTVKTRHVCRTLRCTANGKLAIKPSWKGLERSEIHPTKMEVDSRERIHRPTHINMTWLVVYGIPPTWLVVYGIPPGHVDVCWPVNSFTACYQPPNTRPSAKYPSAKYESQLG